MDIEIHSPEYVILDGFQHFTFQQLKSVLVDYLPREGVFNATVVVLGAHEEEDIVLIFANGGVAYVE